MKHSRNGSPRRTLRLALGLLVAVGGCTSSVETGRHDSGGVSGGASGTGGATNSGGQPGTGGASNSGGQPGTGGASATGGRTSAGGSATGGVTSAGGQPGTGGASVAGGRTGAGGSAAGGATGTGGQPGTGGASVAGGRTGAGGTATGGSGPGAGGSTTDAGVFVGTKTPGTAQTGDITINPATTYQTMDGFGIADVWQAKSTSTAAQRTLFWDPVNGIGMTILRVGIDEQRPDHGRCGVRRCPGGRQVRRQGVGSALVAAGLVQGQQQHQQRGAFEHGHVRDVGLDPRGVPCVFQAERRRGPLGPLGTERARLRGDLRHRASSARHR